jgi:hypothetical protein
MIKARLLIGSVVTAAALLASAVPAFAGFESKNGESDKGTGEVLEVTFEAGGGTVTCKAYTEGASKAEWTVEEAGKAQAKGPDLQIDISKWGECASSKPVTGSVKISECTLEIEQIEEQTKLIGKLVKECTIEAPLGCTIKLGTSTNKALKTVNAGHIEATSKNTLIAPEISNLVTEVNSTCESLGIHKSETGKISGFGEASSVQIRSVYSKFKKIGTGVFNGSGAVNSTSNQEFTFGQTVFKCTEAKMTGSMTPAEADTIEVVPQYGGCTQNNILATVTATDCAIRYSSAIPNQSAFAGNSQLIDTGIGTCDLKFLATQNGESCNIKATKQSESRFFTSFTNGTNELKINHIMSFVPFTVVEAAKCVGNPTSGTNGRFNGSYKIANVNVG